MSGIHLSEIVVAFMLPYCWKFARYSGLGKAGKTSGQDVIKWRLEELSVTRLDFANISIFKMYKIFSSSSIQLHAVVLVFLRGKQVHTDDEGKRQ